MQAIPKWHCRACHVMYAGTDNSLSMTDKAVVSVPYVWHDVFGWQNQAEVSGVFPATNPTFCCTACYKLNSTLSCMLDKQQAAMPCRLQGQTIHFIPSVFWKQKVCPSHRNDGTLQCCSCNRWQPRGEQWVTQLDGRTVCLDCLTTIVRDTADAQPLYRQVGLHQASTSSCNVLAVLLE